MFSLSRRHTSLVLQTLVIVSIKLCLVEFCELWPASVHFIVFLLKALEDDKATSGGSWSSQQVEEDLRVLWIFY